VCASFRRAGDHREKWNKSRGNRPGREKMGRQQQQLCMVFLMAFLVVSTMDVVHVAAGRCTLIPYMPPPATHTKQRKFYADTYDSFVKLLLPLNYSLHTLIALSTVLT
jgi:hypothetical protein